MGEEVQAQAAAWAAATEGDGRRSTRTRSVGACIETKPIPWAGSGPTEAQIVAFQPTSKFPSNVRLRGNRYLRKQLIHGARAAMPHLAAKQTRIGIWLQQLLSRFHPNVVVVALAAKLARIVWAVLRHEKSFDQEILA